MFNYRKFCARTELRFIGYRVPVIGSYKNIDFRHGSFYIYNPLLNPRQCVKILGKEGRGVK